MRIPAGMALPPHARRKLDSEVSRTPSESTQRDDSSSSSTRLQCATAASAASTASSANAASAADPSTTSSSHRWVATADEEYNSADEHVGCSDTLAHDTHALEMAFEKRMERRGLRVKRMLQDGNCFFRAISDRVYGDSEMHDVVRRLCMDYMVQERDHFSAFVTEDFEEYVRRKRRVGVYANHLEIQAQPHSPPFLFFSLSLSLSLSLPPPPPPPPPMCVWHTHPIDSR